MSKGDSYIIVLELPRDVAGTAVLAHANRKRTNDKWLYLPELKRVKRISSGGKTSSFAGSEFSYEDLSSPTVERCTYKWLRDEACPGQRSLTCHVIARYPRGKSSDYSEQIVWLNNRQYRLFRTDFLSRSGGHVKRMSARNHRQYQGRFWLANTLAMTNLRTSKSTVMA